MTAEPTHPGLMSPRALAREEYDAADEGPGSYPRPVPDDHRDPWFCYCGEPIPIDDPACPHGLYLCAEHNLRCRDCEIEAADARADLDAKYAKENPL